MAKRIFSKKEIPESLLSVMYLHLQIGAKTKELSRWRKIAEKASGIVYSHAPGSGGKGRGGSRIEDCIAIIDEIERAITEDMASLVDLKARLSGVIKKISCPRCQSLLSLRYLCGMSWEEVAEAMDYSYVHIVNRLHPKALEQFKDKGSDDKIKSLNLKRSDEI